jgi:hypothetical protein
MASPNRIKASSAKELALPTSLALVSHVLSDAKQTRAGRKSSPPYPPFCRRANTSVFRFESTQRARTRPASLSPQSRRDFFPPFFLFSCFTTAHPTPNEEEKKKDSRLLTGPSLNAREKVGMFCCIFFLCWTTPTAAAAPGCHIKVGSLMLVQSTPCCLPISLA